MREFALATYRRLGTGAVGRFGTGILVTISFTTGAAGAKVKIDGSLDAGSFKNEMPPLKFELGEKGPSSTCNFTRRGHWHS